MIIYNITTKVHPAIDAAWLQWQCAEHIPEIMAAGFFTSFKILRLLEHDDGDGPTYAVQYTAATPEDYHGYLKKYAQTAAEKAQKKWNDKANSFSSLLEVIQ